jgi:hypothetical protein
VLATSRSYEPEGRTFESCRAAPIKINKLADVGFTMMVRRMVGAGSEPEQDSVIVRCPVFRNGPDSVENYRRATSCGATERRLRERTLSGASCRPDDRIGANALISSSVVS